MSALGPDRPTPPPGVPHESRATGQSAPYGRDPFARFARWGVLAQMVRMAVRNLRASLPKTVIVGSIIAGGAFLVVVGSALLDSVDLAMKSSITGSVAGHIQVYNAESKDELLVMGDMSMEAADIEPLEDYSSLRNTLLQIDNVAQVVPMGLNKALITSGNTIDAKLADLRALAVQVLEASQAAFDQRTSSDLRERYAAKKAHVRQMIEVLAKDFRNARKLLRDGQGGMDTDALESLKRAQMEAFWRGFDGAPLAALEFLENKVAPLASDADMLFLNYVGTDPDAFAAVFSRLRIVDGEMIPRGERGFLFSKFMYEEQAKLKTARRLDKIQEGITQRGLRIADDEELSRFVRENQTQTSEILLQLDPLASQHVRSALADHLGESDQTLPALLENFFATTDANFADRYRFFYEEIAPQLDLYRVRLGDNLTIKSFTRGGYLKSLNLKVWGTYAFEGLEQSPQAGQLNLMDLVSFRELYGFMTPESREELEALRADAQAEHLDRSGVEAALFGGPPAAESRPAAETVDTGLDLDALLSGAARDRLRTSAFPPVELEKGVILNAAVVVHDDRQIPKTISQIERAGQQAGLRLKAVSWQAASGLVGQFVNLARTVLVAAVLIIFTVALVIINNSLVMATLQRVQEFGTLRAIGAQKRFIAGMLFVESSVIGLVFGGLGSLLGIAVVSFLGSVGIPAFNDVSAFFFSGPRLYPTFQTANVLWALGVVFVVSLVSTSYPARLAMGVTPRTAMGEGS